MEEHQQDANSALIELDKGLRASKVGEQCEAIVRFPSLFARFPFPILINSAFLKLADTFRTGNNFIRLCILRVAQQSTKHLDKILNVDEFMKRIYIVIHSNDPYARALTLRMLGSVSCMISEKKNAHHSIQQGLDSHDRVEQDAAIFATTQFASHSQQFASSICNKIAMMLQGLSTPLEVKLKLIPVLQHMHFDVQVSSKARTILHDLLPSYPAQDFILTTLGTLTQLAIHSLVDIPAQVTLLLQYLRCDPREAVKSDSLHNLNLLAGKAPHLWTVQNSTTLCEAYKLSTLSNSLKREILRVLCTLTSTESLVQVDMEEGGSILELCRQCCFDFDVIQAALATKLFASLSKHAKHVSKSHQNRLNEEATVAAESLLPLLAASCENSAVDKKALKIVLPALKSLCEVSSDVDFRLIRLLLSLLVNEDVPLGSPTSVMLLQATADMGLSSNRMGVMANFRKQMFELFEATIKIDKKDAESIQKVASLLCVLLFMTHWEDGSLIDGKLQEKLLNSHLNHWIFYRIARQASRMGQHKIANQLFTAISDSVASEQHYFWLIALSDISLAESAVSFHFNVSNATWDKTRNLGELNKAIHHYHKAETSLMAAVTPNHNLLFQCEYIRLRRESLQAHAQLISACSLIRTCPPPAISTMTGGSPGSDGSGSNSGILFTQMKSCAEWFMAVDKSYSKLHMTSFDSDPRTLSIIEILQQACSIMAYAIDLLILSRSSQNASTRQNSNFDSAEETSDDNFYTRAMKRNFSAVMSKLEQAVHADNLSLPLSHTHTECLMQCSSLLLSTPHSFPRYFYQSLQTTNIKLAISPGQRFNKAPVTVEINQRLALKVEGVVQHTSATSHDDDVIMNVRDDERKEGRSKFREVSRVKLVVAKSNQGQTKVNNVKISESDGDLEQIVEPHNDYFSTQFVISFPVAGLYTVVVEAGVKDSDGVWWKTGPKENILIKAYDDNVRIQQQQQQQQQSSQAAEPSNQFASLMSLREQSRTPLP
uniref:Integrator complex subunit 7 n=1 Tax=Phallusia mammillata TaxID=59560 RepID=A0A6F9DF80_9ASCI|nr:integrator complex subunit 7-like [Phallusia mammillata]